MVQQRLNLGYSVVIICRWHQLGLWGQRHRSVLTILSYTIGSDLVFGCSPLGLTLVLKLGKATLFASPAHCPDLPVLLHLYLWRLKVVIAPSARLNALTFTTPHGYNASANSVRMLRHVELLS